MNHIPSIATASILALACGCATMPTGADNTSSSGAQERVNLTYADGKELTLSVVRPDIAAPAAGFPVVLALPPGSGTVSLVDTMLDLYWQDQAQRRGWLVVTPAVFGLDIKENARDLLAAVFGWMDDNLDYDPQRVVLAGTSNGGRGAFDAAVAEPDRFAALLVLPGFFDGQTDALVSLRGKPIRMLVGGNDTTWRTFTEQTRAALESLGIDVQVDIVPNQPHIMQLDPTDLFDWMETATNPTP